MNGQRVVRMVRFKTVGRKGTHTIAKTSAKALPELRSTICFMGGFNSNALKSDTNARDSLVREPVD